MGVLIDRAVRYKKLVGKLRKNIFFTSFNGKKSFFVSDIAPVIISQFTLDRRPTVCY